MGIWRRWKRLNFLIRFDISLIAEHIPVDGFDVANFDSGVGVLFGWGGELSFGWERGCVVLLPHVDIVIMIKSNVQRS